MAPETPENPVLIELREAVQQLEKFRQIVETAELAVVTINENHEVVYMNRAAERMFGYSREELMGGDLAPLIPEEHRERHRHYVERYARTRQAKLMGHAAEVEAQRRDGSRFPVEISFSEAEVAGGLLFTAIMRDLSSEHDLAAQVRRSQRLAILGEMVATVTHEIRSPLALIGGFARQLSKEPELSPKARHKLGIITHEVSRLESILNELGDFSRPQRYDWQETDLGQVVDHVSELMSPELHKGQVKLTVIKHRGLPVIMADRDRLSQVLINLINNAVQACGEAPQVEVEVGPDGRGGALLQVRDWGGGLDSLSPEKVFTPFFTTKQGGTGLGLPVARRIVEEHGGQIELTGNQHGGTTVKITLPSAPAVQQELPLDST